VIPAIRKTTHEADPILAELESLSSKAVNILHSLREELCHAFDRGMIEVNKVYQSIEQYCNNLLKRLNKEEEELLPIARGLLPIEEWFNIAANFLSEESNRKSLAPAVARLPA
jgi:hemerythrin-like domain-containing protein